MTLTLTMIAATVILAWATWCALSHRVNDGVLGKALYALAAIAALAVVLGQMRPVDCPHRAEETLLACIAGLAVRHWWLKVIWPSARRKWRAMQCR